MDSQDEAIVHAAGVRGGSESMDDALISAQEEDAAERSLQEEGARPSSLIPVHKIGVPDKHYELQLMRDVASANELLRRQKRLDPNERELLRSEGKDARRSAEGIAKGEKVKEPRATAMALVCLLSASEATTAAGGAISGAASLAAEKVDGQADSGLGAEYEEIGSFVRFKQKLLLDGWLPVPNPKCREDVVGSHHNDACTRYPDSMSCRACTLVPELTRKTSDGFASMRYSKLGRYLNVSVYGDFRDIDYPDDYGLDVVGWSFEEDGRGGEMEVEE